MNTPLEGKECFTFQELRYFVVTFKFRAVGNCRCYSSVLC